MCNMKYIWHPDSITRESKCYFKGLWLFLSVKGPSCTAAVCTSQTCNCKGMYILSFKDKFIEQHKTIWVDNSGGLLKLVTCVNMALTCRGTRGLYLNL